MQNLIRQLSVQFLVNHGISDIQTGWTFSIQNPNYLGVFQAWNWQVDGIDSTGTATGSAHEVRLSDSGYSAFYHVAWYC